MFDDDFDGYGCHEMSDSWFEDSPYEGIYHQEAGDGDFDTYDDWVASRRDDTDDTDDDTDDTDDTDTDPFDYDDYVREPGDYIDE